LSDTLVEKAEPRYYLLDWDTHKILSAVTWVDQQGVKLVDHVCWRQQFKPGYGFETLQEAQEVLDLIRKRLNEDLQYWQSRIASADVDIVTLLRTGQSVADMEERKRWMRANMLRAERNAKADICISRVETVTTITRM
jgi:hypothetical protein